MAGYSIIWGQGGFAPEDWAFIYKYIKKYNIKSVLEYGVGLTTELLTAVGLEVYSMETQKEFYDLYSQKFKVELCDYEKGYPEFNRKFDLGFVDAPGEAERHDRSKSVIHAKKYCNYIYLHDYDLYQFEQIENDPEWIQLEPYSQRHNHFFIRKEILK